MLVFCYGYAADPAGYSCTGDRGLTLTDLPATFLHSSLYLYSNTGSTFHSQTQPYPPGSSPDTTQCSKVILTQPKIITSNRCLVATKDYTRANSWLPVSVFGPRIEPSPTQPWKTRKVRHNRRSRFNLVYPIDWSNPCLLWHRFNDIILLQLRLSPKF